MADRKPTTYTNTLDGWTEVANYIAFAYPGAEIFDDPKMVHDAVASVIDTFVDESDRLTPVTITLPAYAEAYVNRDYWVD